MKDQRIPIVEIGNTETLSKYPQNGHAAFNNLMSDRPDNQGSHPLGHLQHESSPLSSHENAGIIQQEDRMDVDDDLSHSFEVSKPIGPEEVMLRRLVNVL
jgi:hypothetical protein